MLLVLLMAQVIVLATQVRRPDAVTGESMSLMRVWIVTAFVPAEKTIASAGSGIGNLWGSYIDLRGVRAQNENLQSELDRLRLEEVSLAEDAGQARRLQALLGFREKFISQTVAAQVIGTSGSEHSHVLYIDKGARDGIKADMPVITPKGIVGKISRIFPDNTSQVLEINDATAGAGVMLERSRLRGVLRGMPSGIPEILHIMSDEKIVIGEPVVSSGGDQIYPRGLPIGTVFSIGRDPDGGPFMVVQVKPSADLDRVEEVLVITKVVEKAPEQPEGGTALRAADILAQRLPTVTPKPAEKAGEEPPDTRFLYAKKPATPAAGNPTAGGAGAGTAKAADSSGKASAGTARPPASSGNAAAGIAKPAAPGNSASEASKPDASSGVAAAGGEKSSSSATGQEPQSTSSAPNEQRTKPKAPAPKKPAENPQVQENPQ